MNNIKYSIIIPHYNSPDLLEKLIKSIPIVNYIQIIIVDDNSKTNLEKLNELMEANKHCEFYKNDTGNQSAGACRNVGLKHAKGKWLLFADSDDYFLDGFMEVVEKYYESDNDIIYFIPTSIEIDTGNISMRHMQKEEGINEFMKKGNALKLKYSFIEPWSRLIKNEIVQEKNIKFDETIVANDVMFSTRLATEINKIEASHEKIYCVTMNKGSLTKLLSEEKFDVRLDVFIDRYHYVKAHTTKAEFASIKLRGLPRVTLAYQNSLGIKKIIKTYLKLKKNKVKIFGFDMLNPLTVIPKLRRVLRVKKENKKYGVK